MSIKLVWRVESDKHTLAARGLRKFAVVSQNAQGGYEVTCPANEDNGNERRVFESLPDTKRGAEELAELDSRQPR